MRRRTLLVGTAAAALSPFAAHAQSIPKAAKLALVYPGPKEVAAVRAEAVVSGLRTSGYPVQQMELVVRATEGDPARIAPLVAEVVDSNVAVIIAPGPAVTQAARAATRTIPILAIDLESDPIASGFAVSLAHPGGNVSGVFLDFPDFTAKWIELLRECIPQMARIAAIWHPAMGRVQIDTVQKTADSLKLRMQILEVRAREDFDAAFSLASQHGAEAAILLSSPLVFANIELTAELSLRRRLPAITMFAEFARTGGLLAYGPNLLDVSGQVGVLAGKVLRGQTIAELPIERPSRFELAINLKTAKELGLTISPLTMARADEVIE